MGWICPLTPLEVSLRRRAGDQGYDGGFIEAPPGARWILSEAITRETQIILAVLQWWPATFSSMPCGVARRGRRAAARR